MATNGTPHEEHPTSSQSSEIGGTKAGSSKLSQEEVGWYFVEQYYKTLNKNPDKLHLFYSKQSQYLVGTDAVLTDVSVGRASIQERIKSLDYDNCKVRISNVDTQACGDDKILIQTIGHTANKQGPPKKFVQSFVLASQPSGYFVLNDIMRYMPDQDWEADENAPVPDEAGAASAPQEAEPEVAAAPEAAAKEPEPVEPEAVAEKAAVETAPAAEAEPATIETPAAESVPDAEEPAVKEKAEPAPEPEAAAPEAPVEEPKKVEEAKEAPAAPVAAAQAPVAAEPEKPRLPLKPMTWASRLVATPPSAGGAVRPAVPVAVPKATPPAASQPRQAAPAAAQPTPAPQAAETAPAPAAAKDQGSEWQTAETRRQSKPQSATAAPVKEENTKNMAYIKFVTEKVHDEDLKSFLAGCGELEYFDVNRPKNCAFVEFKTKAGHAAALRASPHVINGETIIIEQRRPKANAYGGSNYNNPRGAPASRGRGGFEPGRTGSPGGGRGGFTGQSRGRGGAPRGRGGAQASTA